MALSQIQCLDDHHVNPRTHESKADFLYCEEQRRALEALVRGGRDAFLSYLRERNLRVFLSDPELDAFAGAAEPSDPAEAEELLPGDSEEPPPSLQYWPELSDTSAPEMDLGWPDSLSYRGVTRTSVYTQPPLEGQAHVKEVVRKMIAQAQKVIAVVMDVFTDSDIFRDLLDAGFKRKVSVYILLERTKLPHFLSMCQRANMHAGHFKHLRVRCTEGVEFCTRSSTKVRGQSGHRFMFIDGDKAVSGSYSFTWMSSRLDRNLITVVTGQAVEAFDQLFHFLWLTSSSVDLGQIPKEPEPEPERLPQPAAVAPPSAADLRKMHNPKYALVATGNPGTNPSAAKNSPKELEDPDVKDRKGRSCIIEAPPLHPGLIDLEKVCLMSYLPIWPEPDPPSDVIGFINVRDAKRPNQVHLQRSEMFETSQAIRFSSPFSMPKEILPEVAQLKQSTHKQAQVENAQATQNNTKTEGCVLDGVEPGDGEAPEHTSPASEQKLELKKDELKPLNAESKLRSNTQINQNVTPQLIKHTTPQSGLDTSAPQTVAHSGPKAQDLNTTKKAETALVTQSVAVCAKNSPESNGPAEQHKTKTDAPPEETLHNSSEMTVSIQPVNKDHTVLSKTPTSVCASVPSSSSTSSVPPLVSPDPPLPPSSSTPLYLALSAPVPKPRTVQLVIRRSEGEGQTLPEISVVRRPEGLGPPGVHGEPGAVNVAQAPPGKESEIVPEPQKTGGYQSHAQTGSPEGAPRQKQSVTSEDTKDDNTDDKAATQWRTKPQDPSDALTTDAAKAQSGNTREVAPAQTDSKASDKHVTHCHFNEKLHKISENLTQCKTYMARACAPQTANQDVDQFKSSISATTNSHITKDSGVTPPQDAESEPSATKPNAHLNSFNTEECKQTTTHAPESPRELRLSGGHASDAERELTPLSRGPTPDGFLPRTPTPEASDGYVSPREGSILSTTSDEYYECSGSPSHDPGFTSAGGCTFTHNRTTNANTNNSASRVPRETEATNGANGRHGDGRDQSQGHRQQQQSSSAPPRPPPRAAGVLSSASGRKQDGQRGLLSRQASAPESRTRIGHLQNQRSYPSAQTSSALRTRSNAPSQLHPPFQSQERGSPFTLTFSRLYHLKGLKDKMSLLPPQSKRGGTGSSGRKSTG